MTHRPKQRNINWSKDDGWSKEEQVGYNQAVNDCMAYTDDLLRPLEEVNEDIIEDWRNPNYDLNHVISLSNKMKEAIQSVLAKHKARTGDGA